MNVAHHVTTATVSTDWTRMLPELTGRMVTLRELEPRDAAPLFAMLATTEVARFISPPPATVEAFAQFIELVRCEREQGRRLCFAVVPNGATTAVGLFHVRALDAGFMTAEWGFALGTAYWGSGMFADAARLTADFLFDVVGAARIEARAAVANGRGNGALRKLGAVKEGVLRKSFRSAAGYTDQILWSILKSEWRQAKSVWGSRVQIH